MNPSRRSLLKASTALSLAAFAKPALALKVFEPITAVENPIFH